MRYTTLQAGRFVAAIAVLVYHVACHGRDILGFESILTRPVSTYYFRTSVIFFFALSGFVLAHGIQSASLRRFLSSRLLRLFPSYWLAVALVWFVREMAVRPLPCDFKSVIYALTLYPAGPGSAAYALGIEWTLVYELFLSLALIPFAAMSRRWGLGLGTTIWLAVIFGKTIANSGTMFLPFPKSTEISFSVANVAFLLGVLGYLLHKTLAKIRLVLPVIVIVAMWLGAEFASTHAGWSMWCQSLGTMAAVSFIATGKQLDAKNPFVKAGDWSYGIYLMHVPVMTAIFVLSSEYYGVSNSLAVLILGGITACVVSATYGEIEWRVYRRLRAMGHRKVSVLPLSTPIEIRLAA